MEITLDSKTEARIAGLADRLGFRGPDASRQVLLMAIADLDSRTPLRRGKPTPEERAAIRKDLERFRANGRRWREEHPDQYDENNPPSKAWQEELYDENGLPK